MSPNEVEIKAVVDTMVSLGLRDLGYRYVNLDDGIVSAQRDANGDLVPDPTGFPSGFKALADYIHSQGMLFGVYTDRGSQTCGGRAGAQSHEFQDAAFYARNEIDYLKEDSCNAPQDHPTAFHEYGLMRDALNATGRSFFFSLCGWESWYASLCHALGNSCRIGPDDSNWRGVLVDIDAMAPLQVYAGPGAWNDPCLLLGRDKNGNVDVTDQQGRAQFSMWAIMAAPLLMSSNVRNLTAFQLETYSNVEVIAVDQDILGRPGQRLVGGDLSGGGSDTTPTTLQTCVDNSPAQQWSFNTPATGYMQNIGSTLCLNTDDCSPNIQMFECILNGPTCCGATCVDNMKFIFNTNGSITSPSMPGTCLTDNGLGNQVSLQTCGSSVSQVYTFDATAKTVRGGVNNLCLTAGSMSNATQANIWGRPLSDGSWAFTFINAHPTQPQDLVCDQACLSATGWEPEILLSVRDLWAHSYLANTTAGVGISVSQLAPNGGVEMYKLTPLL